ncbi:cupredoxin domain-containing protein [Ferruginibacter sp. SUN002]|uniref:cupredoxin domain-containing protein n=1 Tax=Ferruginibacter sp. SUN002 TaxID=2937789 RepID=UPI003D36790C
MKNKSIFSLTLLFAFVCTITLSCSKKDEEMYRDISITDAGFVSSNFIISDGRLTVIWGNVGSVPHNVTSDTGSELGSPNIVPGKSFPHTFTKSGFYKYHCSLHPTETGSVTVP